MNAFIVLLARVEAISRMFGVSGELHHHPTRLQAVGGNSMCSSLAGRRFDGNGETLGDYAPPAMTLGGMTLRDCRKGLARIVSLASASAWLEAVPR